MERILRSEEVAEIILLPVRHHSPACAFHVSRMIEALKPDLILIEGPDNANSLIPVMVHEDTKAPFAIYYSYNDATGRISEEKERYKCYYPFLDYSPELVALREGARLDIPAQFMDLPYGDILAASREGKGLLNGDDEKSNYNDDYLLSRNEYLKQLCEKTGMRSFDEFWEKYFELNGLREDSETWFANLLTYCSLARENTPPESMEEDGCLARERFMAARIMEYADGTRSVDGSKAVAGTPGETQPAAASDSGDEESQGIKKILAVTGGFHTPGLKALLEEMPGEKPSQETAVNASTEETDRKRSGKAAEKAEKEGKTSPKAISQVPEKDQGVYLMPYSMEAADALNGYASGMPFPGFYQRIWEKMPETDAPCGEAVLDLIVASGKETRKKEGYLSTYDEICACSMAQGLAGLRGKREPGAYELLDAVLSSFVKGEYNLSSDTPMRVLKTFMTGNAVGVLCSQADVPPIIHDFEEQCRKFALKVKSTMEAEATLSIFSNKKHRQESMFFNRMAYLQTAFAKRVKGPNLQLKKDKNLMREIWKYKWSAQVNAALIDVSVYGATIGEASAGLVREELKKELSARESALLLTHVFEMGLEEQLQAAFDRVHELMLSDTDFYSLSDAVKSLLMMEELGGLYDSQMAFGELIHLGCQKLIMLLPSMTRIKDEALTPSMNALKLLYQITGRGQDALRQEREAFHEALVKMCQDVEIHPGLNGCIQGILYGSGARTAEEIETVCRGYLLGTKEQMLQTAQFFKGLFYTARDLVFIGEEFLKMLDGFYGRVSEEEFMELLPELRMAFAYFTPREIDKIAASAAGLHGRGRRDIMERQEVFPDWYSYGRSLDTYARENMSVMSRNWNRRSDNGG